MECIGFRFKFATQHAFEYCRNKDKFEVKRTGKTCKFHFKQFS